MNTHTILEEFLQNNTLMQLATQSDKGLWVCSVYFAHDSDNNIYWTSARFRRHSKEIEANPNVAVTIVNDSEKKQAVQISGKAYRVLPEESASVDELYGAKLGRKDRLTEILQDTEDSRAYWVLKPEQIELWDEVNFSDDPKQPITVERDTSA